MTLMEKQINLTVSADVSVGDLVGMVTDSIDHQNIPEFIRCIDLDLADMEITEKIICLLLDSMKEDVIDAYGEESERAGDWEIYTRLIKKIMHEIE